MPPTTEPQGMLTVDQMVAELYRTVCVSKDGAPCLIDKVNSHEHKIEGHEKWIRGHDSQPGPTILERLGYAFLASIAGALGVGLVGIIGWGTVTVLRRALGAG